MMNCDFCDNEQGYSEENPYVEVRVPRPSDHSDLACIMAGHAKCYGYVAPAVFEAGNTPSLATPKEWGDYIESDLAVTNGHMWLT